MHITDIINIIEPTVLKVLNLNSIQNYYITLNIPQVLLVSCYMHPVLWCNPHCYGTQIAVFLKQSQTTNKKTQHKTVFTWGVVSSLIQ